jgi:hypothetical protein
MTRAVAEPDASIPASIVKAIQEPPLAGRSEED